MWKSLCVRQHDTNIMFKYFSVYNPEAPQRGNDVPDLDVFRDMEWVNKVPMASAYACSQLFMAKLFAEASLILKLRNTPTQMAVDCLKGGIAAHRERIVFTPPEYPNGYTHVPDVPFEGAHTKIAKSGRKPTTSTFVFNKIEFAVHHAFIRDVLATINKLGFDPSLADYNYRTAPNKNLKLFLW